MKNFAKLILGGCAAAVLVACGGGNDPAPAPKVATQDASVAASPATVPAVVNTPLVFPGGVAEFGKSTPVSLTFTSTAASPAFKIESGGGVAKGTTTFGSCVFTITESSFLAPDPLAVGNSIRINPCNLNVNSAGENANGIAESRSIKLQLGTALSSGATVTVVVASDGSVVVNGVTVTTVETKPTTGGY